jgi:chemotaxis protein methyltransferase CheR
MRKGGNYSAELENLELELLTQAVGRLRGVNLAMGSAAPLRRRAWEAVRREKARSLSGLLEQLLHDPGALDRFLETVLPPFVPYNAGFLQNFRCDLAPLLRTYPFARVWQIGCSSVFETYVLAIILHEEGLAEKATLYATDVNDAALENCASGAFPLSQLEKCEKAYKKSGGRSSLSDYFSGGGRTGIFDSALRRHMVVARHNLATDGSPNEFNAILCRHPLKFYDRTTRERAHRIIHESLVPLGILGLTQGENLECTPSGAHYTPFNQECNLYRKIA